jgi:hypothetical protein
LRSDDTLIAPVVKRQVSRERDFFFQVGKPIRRPRRRPLLELLQFCSALASPSSPDEYASFEFSAHHGATCCFA